MDFKISSRMRSPRIIPVKVNAAGNLVIPQAHVTSSKTATGEYTLTVKPGFQQLPYFFGTATKDGVSRKFLELDKSTIGLNTLKIKAFTIGDVAADTAFSGFILGSDGGSPTYGVVDQPVRIPMNRARLLFFSYNGSTNVMQAGLNPHEGTINKTGTGLYTLTLRQPFFKDCYVGVQCNSITRLAEVVSADNKTISIEVINTADGSAADGEIFIWIIGQRARIENLRMLYPLYCPHPYTVLNPFEYDGSTDSMIRGSAYMGKSKASTTYTFTSPRRANKSSYGLAITDGAAIVGAVNTRTDAGFNVDVEADARVYALEIQMRRGRIWG